MTRIPAAFPSMMNCKEFVKNCRRKIHRYYLKGGPLRGEEGALFFRVKPKNFLAFRYENAGMGTGAHRNAQERKVPLRVSLFPTLSKYPALRQKCCEAYQKRIKSGKNQAYYKKSKVKTRMLWMQGKRKSMPRTERMGYTIFSKRLQTATELCERPTIKSQAQKQ
jgi:hypothetical protein